MNIYQIKNHLNTINKNIKWWDDQIKHMIFCNSDKMYSDSDQWMSELKECKRQKALYLKLRETLQRQVCSSNNLI
jgi:hypothetical protein